MVIPALVHLEHDSVLVALKTKMGNPADGVGLGVSALSVGHWVSVLFSQGLLSPVVPLALSCWVSGSPVLQ